jgi:hypothetical protein|uniref:Uncharacterized protein n=2 Tax=Zea mays TaxID=4577 RepID=A0A804Q4L5_MAIZE
MTKRLERFLRMLTEKKAAWKSRVRAKACHAMAATEHVLQAPPPSRRALQAAPGRCHSLAVYQQPLSLPSQQTGHRPRELGRLGVRFRPPAFRDLHEEVEQKPFRHAVQASRDRAREQRDEVVVLVWHAKNASDAAVTVTVTTACPCRRGHRRASRTALDRLLVGGAVGVRVLRRGQERLEIQGRQLVVAAAPEPSDLVCLSSCCTAEESVLVVLTRRCPQIRPAPRPGGGEIQATNFDRGKIPLSLGTHAEVGWMAPMNGTNEGEPT